MATVKVVTAQRDFSAGEVDSDLKRDDERPEFKAGLRQASNVRILNSKKLTNRSGRRALFQQNDRVEEILMAPGVTYYLAFTAGLMVILNSAWVVVLSEARPWTADTAKDVSWAPYDKSLYVTFPGMVPRIYTWDGNITWAAADFAETISSGGQKRTPFYRMFTKGVTLLPSATTGAINITFSANYLTAGMIGTRLRYIDRQLTITGVTNPGLGTATVNEPLPASQVLNFGVDPRTVFKLGDFVQGTVSNAIGYVVTTAAGFIGVQLMSSKVSGISGAGLGANQLAVTAVSGFVVTDIVVGQGGSILISSLGAIGTPAAVPFWDEEVMNTFRGYPRKVFVDQNRLGFNDFPSLPSGIAWSRAPDFTDFYPGPNPTDAIFELAPKKSQVLYCIPGMDGSLFVFCDNRLYYIPITVQNPLKPGSVQFSVISEDECGAVQPRRAGEFILYATGGLNQLMALRIYGAYTRAYRTESVTELSAHLFTSIKAIAIMTASASFAERYIFVLNSAGDVVVGKYAFSKNNELEGVIGWTPWFGKGVVKWVSCKGANILFTSTYFGVPLVEALDDSIYLDASQLYNTQPFGLPGPPGMGPLWYFANDTVDLVDGPLGTRMMGNYQVDQNGFLVRQFNAGEDFTSPFLRAGQAWTATIEPFVPGAQPGQDVKQRMNKRGIDQLTVYVRNSTGFLLAGQLKSGTTIPGGPALGTVMQQWRIDTWNQDDDPTQPPPLREEAYERRPTGRDHDPRWAIIKDTPGPLTILELATEVSV